MATSNPPNLASAFSSEAQPQFESSGRLRSLPTTQVLIAANVLIFLAMVFQSVWPSGAHRFIGTGIGTDFDDKLMLLWGSNYGPLTLGGQYWRVLTCLFVHFSIFHLSGNMLFLWLLGRHLDRHLSRMQTLVLYLFTGAAYC